MNKQEKITYINNLKKDLDNNPALMVYHYDGLNVKQIEDLRKKMRESGAILKVTKNRITKIALKETPHKVAENLFTGQTGIALSKDPITLAKVLVKFQKDNTALKIVGGIMESKLLSPAEVSEIATLPTLEEARAKIVGILQAPAQKLLSILLAPGAKIANLAHAKSLKTN